jgi:energy-coupling factor transporter ATP-binding protein EcfA2
MDRFGWTCVRPAADTGVMAKTSREPARAPFARDEPVALERDAFGHADYVRALGSIVTDDDAPSTVGVFGPWGVGKSTIVEALPSVLPEDTAYAYFDAWKYEDDSLRRQFLRACTSQLEAKGQLNDFSVKKNLAELDVDSQQVEEGLSVSWRHALRAAMFGVLVGAAVYGLLTIGVLSDFIKHSDNGQRLAAAVAAVLVGAIASLLNQIIVVTEMTITRRSLADPDRFAGLFADFLAAVKPDRLVIVIDNLDRCAPEKAVETLSTIKTYLEPTVKGDRPPASSSQPTVEKQVTFVISVDDDALCRHLVAQEMQRSQTTSDEDQARIYVDEYLAKFFSARLPIRPILPDDIRHYIEENLSPLITARGVDNDDGRALIGLVATGLRRNPRQVKQFVNDLESRLRLLQERETPHGDKEPGISPAVSGEILMIAKLALLESGFPREFARLLDQHRKLDEWHATADSNTEVWIDEPPDEGTADEQAHAEAFASFLQASRSIRTDNLRALLHLKQAREEAGLPGFQQFRDAVVNEDQPEVERLLTEASPEERHGYAKRMPQLLRDEKGQGYWPAARAAVRMMIAVEALADFKTERMEVLKIALDDPTLRNKELVFLDPEALLNAGRDLSKTRQTELLGPVVTRFVKEGQSPEDRQSAAEAIGPFASLLARKDRDRIRAAINEDGLQSAFDLYVSLARADADLLPSGVARAALEELAKPDDQERNSLLGRDAAFEVAKVALAQEADADLDQLAIERVVACLDGTAADPDGFNTTVGRAIELLTPLRAAPGEQWTLLAEHVQGQWPNYPRQHDAALLELEQLALSRTPEDARTTVAGGLAPTLFQDVAGGVALVTEAKASLIPELKLPVVEQLTEIGKQHEGQREAAAALLSQLHPDDAGTRIGQLVVAAAQQGQDESAVRLLNQHAADVKAHQEQIASELLSWSESELGTAVRVPYLTIGHLTKALTPEQLEQVARIAIHQLSEGSDDATSALNEFARLGAKKALEAILEKVVETVEGVEALAGSPSQELLSRTAEHVGVLSTSEQKRLSTKLEAWIDPLEQRAAVFAIVRRMRGLRAEAANPLVAKLLEASGQEVAEQEAVQALLAADAISGKRDSRARRRLDAQLSNLEKGSDEDRAVARAFEQARD